MDPFHGYKNANDDQLQDAVAVLDAFHVLTSPPKSSTTCTAGCSRRPPATGAGGTTRCTACGPSCAPAKNTSPTANAPAQGRVHRSRGAPRGRGRLAMRPAGPLGVPPGHPRQRPGDRAEGPRRIRLLPDPRGRPPREDPAPVARSVPGLLRDQPVPPKAAPKPSTASSSSTAASPETSETGRATGSGCSSSAAAYPCDPTLIGEEPPNASRCSKLIP